jgi:guanylate cyclase
VARVARFAIDAVAAAANVLIDTGDPSKGAVVLRAGFDCGPAMACVVGTRAKKFVLLGEKHKLCRILTVKSTSHFL